MDKTTTTALALAKRTVHIKIHPIPQTFAERREILRVLEQFGEVSMFRSLKYSPRTPIPDAFLTLFSSPSAANTALNSTPLRYRLLTTPPSPPLSPDQKLEATVAPLENPPPSPPATEKTFELHISPSSFNHGLYLSSASTNPLNGPYSPVGVGRSYVAASLDSVLPRCVWAPGLRDWETDGAVLRDGAKVGGEEGKGGGGKSVEWSVGKRRRKRSEESKVMQGLTILRKEWETRQRGRGTAPP
ncbi:hypothetical protein BJ875DRAFT_89870 [Amylocarpus encephaloides]|uniref:Uncharacterized protein n=1 Tax=Amylocarpus encephaloides TaxID=45428 RepID=A0A9P7YER0_9HELO|nr:hypothetical protein BJ875DRAFT_89870 [Amylocarpus encephaloides]